MEAWRRDVFEIGWQSLESFSDFIGILQQLDFVARGERVLIAFVHQRHVTRGIPAFGQEVTVEPQDAPVILLCITLDCGSYQLTKLSFNNIFGRCLLSLLLAIMQRHHSIKRQFFKLICDIFHISDQIDASVGLPLVFPVGGLVQAFNHL